MGGPEEYVIDVARLWGVTRRRWGTVLLTIAMSCGVASLYMHAVTPRYLVTMEITSVQTQRMSSGTLSALGSLANIDIGNGGSGSSFRILLNSLQSPIGAEQLMRNGNIIVGMFPDEWSIATKTWKPPAGQVSTLIRIIKSVLGFPAHKWTPPTDYAVYHFLQRNIVISQDAKSGVVTLQMQSSNSKFATTLLSTLVVTVDNLMRERLLARTAENIAFLNRRLNTVTVEDYRRALVQTLADQEKQRMLASGNSPYAAEILGNPVTSDAPVFPAGVPILIVAILLGTILGIFLARVADVHSFSFAKIAKRLRVAP